MPQHKSPRRFVIIKQVPPNFLNLSAITPLILTFNEEANIERTLAALDWASQIVVIDSQSADGTAAILRRHSVVQTFSRRFDNHTSQWNFGLEKVETEWVLALDADYVLSETLVTELRALSPRAEVNAYFTSFVYCVHGKPLRGTLYPPRATLFRRAFCNYVADGHTQLLRVTGKTSALKNPIFHDDRKPLRRWLDAQANYVRLETTHLLSTAPRLLKPVDRVRRAIVFAPALAFLYTLFVKRLVFDGPAGWFYVLQRTYSELLLSLHLLERKFSKVSISREAVSSPESPQPPASSTVPD